jgi:hypothetical protein
MKTIDILLKVLFGTLTLVSFIGLFLADTQGQFIGGMLMTAILGLGFYTLIKIGSYGKL